jgi:predicted esterase
MAGEYSIETTTHGRYLVDGAGPGKPMLVGFHGYAESAETELNRLESIPGSDRWTLVAIQGLHRFYRRRMNDVVASWMTRQDRLLAIQDNTSYVKRVIDAVANDTGASNSLVLSGFSQGVAMAFRAAAASSRRVRGIIALAGDIPPDIETTALAHIPAVLIGIGSKDEWYTAEKLASDEQRLRAAGIHLQVCSFDAGHEWTATFARAAAGFLDSIVKDDGMRTLSQ